MSDPRSRIPSVDALIAAPAARDLVERYGRERAVEAIRAAVDTVRHRIIREEAEAPSGGAEGSTVRTAGDGEAQARAERVEVHDTYLELAAAALEAEQVPSLRPVINATGVVLHTNLGRAPLADAAIEAMRVAGGRYTNLEFDLESGERGSRYTHCVSLLTELTGAEDALVVNNAAGGLVLALNTMALGAGVAVSRGELVEIGGGFRIPEVLERAGARLVEVGSTNRTRLSDYRRALSEDGAVAVLKVHRSNFRITGFTEDAALPELSELAREAGIPLVHDLGSGLMIDAAELGLPDEPRAAASVAEGATVVVVSGDKLLGGPQAGLIVGSADRIGRMRENPLCRALRVDKVTLAGLEATLRLYRDPGRALREIPTLRMLSEDAGSLRERAEALLDRLESERAPGGVESTAGAERGEGTARAEIRLVETKGAVGGGTFPGVELPSWAVELRPGPPGPPDGRAERSGRGSGAAELPGGADRLAAALRDGDPPVVGRIVDDAVLLDVRTVLPGQEDDLARRIREALAP